MSIDQINDKLVYLSDKNASVSDELDSINDAKTQVLSIRDKIDKTQEDQKTLTSLYVKIAKEAVLKKQKELIEKEIDILSSVLSSL